jgi:aminopeptidase
MNKNLNGLIVIRAPRSLTHLKDIDAKKIALNALTSKPAKEIMDKREEAGLFSWTLGNFPTEALAKSAGMDINAYAAQIKKACYLNEKDPVKKWQELYKNMKAAADWLNGLKIDVLKTQSENMDLTVSLGQDRKFICARGCNIPSFELFTSPDWRGVKGSYFADMKSLRSGTVVDGIKLEFRDGRIVKSSAAWGEDFLKKMITLDRGAAQVGEYSLTDIRFSKIDKFMSDTLFDENFGGAYGNCHVALGASYSDTFNGDIKKLTKSKKRTLGFNESSLHWDIINTERKTVRAKLQNGKTVTIYEDGKFKF